MEKSPQGKKGSREEQHCHSHCTGSDGCATCAVAMLGTQPGQCQGWGTTRVCPTFMYSALSICSEGGGLCCKGLGSQTSTINLKGWQERRKGQKSQAEHKSMQGSTGNRTWGLSWIPMAQLLQPLEPHPAKAAKPGAPSQGCVPTGASGKPCVLLGCLLPRTHWHQGQQHLSSSIPLPRDSFCVFMYRTPCIYIQMYFIVSRLQIHMYTYTLFYTLYIVQNISMGIYREWNKALGTNRGKAACYACLEGTRPLKGMSHLFP